VPGFYQVNRQVHPASKPPHFHTVAWDIDEGYLVVLKLALA